MISQKFNQQTYVALRPLSKGIDRETPPQLLEVGAFYDLQNVDVRRGGLRRRGGYGPFITGLPTIDDRVYGNPLFYDEYGNPESVLFTTKHVWKINEGNTVNLLSRQLYTGLEGDVEVSVVYPSLFTVTTAGETFLTDDVVQTGDTLWVGGVATGVPYEILDIEETVLTIKSHDGSLELATDVTYDIVDGFRNVPDWEVIDNNLVFTDNADRPLQTYNGTEVVDYNSQGILAIDTVASVGYRLWIGGITEDGVNVRNRIRWTDVTDLTTFPTMNFVDLPIGRSGIQRLLPLGNLLVAYFRERIFFGRPTNIINRPYEFTIYDTGNVGLVGPRAVTQWLDAHWFVGQDDIYSFSASRALEPIGTRVVRETVQNPDVDLRKTLVVPDPVNERIVFQFFGKSSKQIRDLWGYYYKTGGWSREPFFGKGYFFGRTVEGTFFNEDDAEFPWDNVKWLKSWTFYRPITSEEKTFAFRGNSLYLYEEDRRRDNYSTESSTIDVVIESGDFDFGSPNVLKAVVQMSVKMESPVEQNVVFEVEASNNRSAKWKPLGRLVIDQGQDEGKVDFRMTGSLFRFRLRSSTEVRRWTLNEVVLVASEVGREHVFV